MINLGGTRPAKLLGSNSMLKTSLKHGLTSLFKFSGRDGRELFWPFAGCAFAVATLIWTQIFSVEVRRMAARIEAFAAEHPDLASVSPSGNSFSISTAAPPELMPNFALILNSGLVIGGAFILTVAAAVVRRLRDSGRSPLWSLLPLPFLTYGMVGFGQLMRNFREQSEPSVWPFLMLFFNNIIYMAALGWLVILLARPSATAPSPSR